MNYDCTPIDTRYLKNGYTIAVFDYTANTWPELPDDLGRPKIKKLADGRKEWTYHSKETDMDYVLYWIDYEVSTAPDGSRRGNHNFCGVYVK